MMPYILHAGLVLAACLAFYKILLQNETFYQLNRFVLLACLVLSFALPLLPIPQQWSFQRTETPLVTTDWGGETFSPTTTVLQWKELGEEQPTVQAVTKQPPITLEQLFTMLFWLYWFGVVVFTLNFLVQVATLVTRIYCHPVIRDGRFTIVELPGNTAPCSFGNIIFINPEKYDWETYNQIILHEKIHIEQQHTIDILLAEIVLIFQWFNPFAWMYRKEVENNLEFLTDDQMLSQSAVDKTSYQMNLLKVSAPHFPLSLTTNYNQSLLKKRVIMMNAKKSNINTTWKYLFLFPLFAISVCLLNEPIVNAQAVTGNKQKEKQKDNPEKTHQGGLETEGLWFGTIKNDKVSLQFKNDDDESNSMNGSTFPLADFKDLPRERSGTFSLTRDAGTIQFTGKFEGLQGMGRYKFTADKSFSDFMRQEGIDATEDRDLMTFFMVNVSKSYVQMLKAEGYTSLTKHDLVPLAALKIDGAYIRSLKEAGFPKISLQHLIPFKSLGIDKEFIKDIRTAYPNVSENKLITFKAQGINGKYIADVRDAAKKGTKAEREPVIEKEPAIPGPPGKPERAPRPKPQPRPLPKPADQKEISMELDEDASLNDIVAFKALNVDAAYIRSLQEFGYENLSNKNLIAMKAQGITPAYIKSLQGMGYKNVSASDIIGMKAQNITGDFIKSFEAAGFTNIPLHDVIPLKALGVTPVYIKSFHDAGFKDVSLKNVVALKAQGITPDMVRSYKDLGFENLTLNDVIAARATGTTPSFINSMKEKGHNLKSINKYIQLKSIVN